LRRRAPSSRSARKERFDAPRHRALPTPLITAPEPSLQFLAAIPGHLSRPPRDSRVPSYIPPRTRLQSRSESLDHGKLSPAPSLPADPNSATVEFFFPRPARLRTDYLLRPRAARRARRLRPIGTFHYTGFRLLLYPESRAPRLLQWKNLVCSAFFNRRSGDDL